MKRCLVVACLSLVLPVAGAGEAVAPSFVRGQLLLQAGTWFIDRCDSRQRLHFEDRSPHHQLTPVVGELAGNAPALIEISGELQGSRFKATTLNLLRARTPCREPLADGWQLAGSDWSGSVSGGNLRLRIGSRSYPPQAGLKTRRDGEHLHWQSRRFSLQLSPELCRLLPGAAYGWTAVLQRGKQTLNGCAWRGLD